MYKEKHNLLIIGNGFDLHCNLLSSFKDFFDYGNTSSDKLSRHMVSQKSVYFLDYIKGLHVSIPNYNWSQYPFSNLGGDFEIKLKLSLIQCIQYIQYIKQSGVNSNLNFFLIYFNELKNIQFLEKIYNWSDVENQLYSLLNNYSNLINKIATLICNSYNNFSSIKAVIKNILSSLDDYFRYRTTLLDSTNIVAACLALMLSGFMKIHSGKMNHMNLYDFLFNQLESFENDFSNYINNEEKLHRKKIFKNGYGNYLKNVKDTLIYIRKTNNDLPQNILSFNYTSFGEIKNGKGLENDNPYDYIRHIHSTFDNHPIMGIDSSLSNSKDYRFTKAYRIMNLTHDKEAENHILPKYLKDIIFYGHSLGKEDYLYFVSIFNHYDIYNSNIRLIFYYSFYDNRPGKHEYIRRQQYSSIYRLINKYGKLIHKNDLLYKLLLENRIIIKIMPTLSNIYNFIKLCRN